MKIRCCLIVEDDDTKSENLREYLEELNGNLNIVIKKSLNSGLRDLSYNDYDIIILDMSLPLFEGKRSRTFKPFGGKDFLEEMERIGNITPVIVVTQLSKFSEGNSEMTFDEVKQYCERNFANCLNVVYYLNSFWKDEIKKILEV